MAPNAMAAFLDDLQRTIDPGHVRSILDIGCGTGRFAVALHERFDAPVIGLDPSRSMLDQARQVIDHPAVQFVRAKAESLPLPAACTDLAFLSMVYHHLHDAARTADELSRVLRAHGHVCIRNSLADILDTFVHLRYFPEARCILEQRLPRKQDVVMQMQRCGFHLVADADIHVEFAPSFAGLYEKVQLRAQSELASISDAAFSEGLERMAIARAAESANQPVIIGVAQLVFRRVGDDMSQRATSPENAAVPGA